MHYYKFNIADYRKDTGHLSTIEHGIYRQLIDWYYLDENPIPLETQVVSRRLRLASEVEVLSLQNVLSDFFKEAKSGYVHKRIELDINDYHEQAEKNQRNGKLGGRPKKTQVVIDGLPDASQNNPNHKPLTNNHKPSGEATRISQDWFLSKSFGEWAAKERPDIDVRKEAEQFKDFWLGQPDDKGFRKDWFAVWRHWVRGCHVAKPNPADRTRLTVAPSNEPDPALTKIIEDAKKAAPMPDFVRQFAKQVRKA